MTCWQFLLRSPDKEGVLELRAAVIQFNKAFFFFLESESNVHIIYDHGQKVMLFVLGMVLTPLSLAPWKALSARQPLVVVNITTQTLSCWRCKD